MGAGSCMPAVKSIVWHVRRTIFSEVHSLACEAECSHKVRDPTLQKVTAQHCRLQQLCVAAIGRVLLSPSQTYAHMHAGMHASCHQHMLCLGSAAWRALHR